MGARVARVSERLQFLVDTENVDSPVKMLPSSLQPSFGDKLLSSFTRGPPSRCQYVTGPGEAMPISLSVCLSRRVNPERKVAQGVSLATMILFREMNPPFGLTVRALSILYTLAHHQNKKKNQFLFIIIFTFFKAQFSN